MLRRNGWLSLVVEISHWVGEQTDLKNLSLYPNQTAMVDTVLATGKPVILVMFTNLPANITALVAHPSVKAIVQAYYPQHWGGQAVVDVLTGVRQLRHHFLTVSRAFSSSTPARTRCGLCSTW